MPGHQTQNNVILLEEASSATESPLASQYADNTKSIVSNKINTAYNYF